MIIDERTYTLHPGKLPEFLELYQAEGYPVQTSHLGEPIGFFQTEIGVLHQIVHLWGYENMGDREQRRAKMQADPAWQAYLRKSTPMFREMQNRILVPTPFSRIR